MTSPNCNQDREFHTLAPFLGQRRLLERQLGPWEGRVRRPTPPIVLCPSCVLRDRRPVAWSLTVVVLACLPLAVQHSRIHGNPIHRIASRYRSWVSPVKRSAKIVQSPNLGRLTILAPVAVAAADCLPPQRSSDHPLNGLDLPDIHALAQSGADRGRDRGRL